MQRCASDCENDLTELSESLAALAVDEDREFNGAGDLGYHGRSGTLPGPNLEDGPGTGCFSFRGGFREPPGRNCAAGPSVTRSPF